MRVYRVRQPVFISFTRSINQPEYGTDPPSHPPTDNQPTNQQFLAKTGTKSMEVKEKGLDKACGDLLRKLCEKCVACGA